jgi:hypothetical protein
VDPNRLHRFQLEVQAAGSLNHANILAVYDIRTHGRSSDLVSELLEGQTLSKRLREQKLTVSRSIDIARQRSGGRNRPRFTGLQLSYRGGNARC